VKYKINTRPITQPVNGYGFGTPRLGLPFDIGMRNEMNRQILSVRLADVIGAITVVTVLVALTYDEFRNNWLRMSLALAGGLVCGFVATRCIIWLISKYRQGK
jgi:hypothetical protein